ncbi:MAG: N-acetylglucosamine-6-phosphate deacetylase [Pseudomonadota bacterium]
MTSITFINGEVLIDGAFVEDAVVSVSEGRIETVSRSGEPEFDGDTVVDLNGASLLPGFVDVQVNGGGGVLFNDNPSVEAIKTIAEAHHKFGVTSLLPTLISDDLSKIETALCAVDDAIEARVPGIVGLHVEGPFLNADRRGIHDKSKIRTMTDEWVARLSASRRGALVVTLAPDRVETHQIAALSAAGVKVCAGHTEATYEETWTALEAGLSGFTHLYNAMAPLQTRTPGIVAAALESSAWCGLIVDGKHVHPAMLRLALRAKHDGRMMLVSDAMPSVGAQIDHFYLGEKRISVRDGECVSEDGTLAGAALEMRTAYQNAIEMLALPRHKAAALASTEPAAFLGMSNKIGRIAPGFKADFVVLSPTHAVQEVWIDGVRMVETKRKI